MTLATPKRLDELFPIFAQLEAGESVGLVSSLSEFMTDALQAPAEGGWLGVTSSGSTGRPKLQWRRWSELRDGASARSALREWAWASPYDPWTFAGVQVAVQAWVSGGRLVSLGRQWGEAWQQLVESEADAVSATPTYLDLLMQNEPAGCRDWQPKQVTLGGEPLRPGVGRRLRGRFGQAHFTVIYATAELGVLLKTHRVDGWYEHQTLGTQDRDWRVVENELQVRRDDQWHCTGDRVEVSGGLLRVPGRADLVANVAGTKVSLIDVSEAAEQVAGVLRAVAVAEPNPVTGQIVCLKFAIEPGAAATEVQRRVESELRSRLRKEAWPRRWVIDDVGPSRNAKRELGIPSGLAGRPTASNDP